MKTLIFTTMLCAVTALCGEPAAGGKHPTPFRVVGYLPTYRMATIRKEWGKQLTDIIYFSIEPKADGGLNTDKFNVGALKKIHAIAGPRNVRVSICLGGWAKSKGFGPMAVDAERRKAFITNLLNFCEKHEFAGADFDWEFPKNQKEKDAYSTLLIETKKAFRPHGLLVTIAVGSTKRLSEDAYKAVDFIHVMSYDHGVRHSTFEASVADLKRQLTYGAPKEKLVLGVPFYGRNMKKRSDASTYVDIVKEYKPAPTADEAGGIFFNGIETIRKKTKYAFKNGLAGVMIWEIGQDTTDKTSLLKAINDALPDQKNQE